MPRDQRAGMVAMRPPTARQAAARLETVVSRKTHHQTESRVMALVAVGKTWTEVKGVQRVAVAVWLPS